jgi:hypothetical protein
MLVDDWSGDIRGGGEDEQGPTALDPEGVEEGGAQWQGSGITRTETPTSLSVDCVRWVLPSSCAMLTLLMSLTRRCLHWRGEWQTVGKADPTRPEPPVCLRARAARRRWRGPMRRRPPAASPRGIC